MDRFYRGYRMKAHISPSDSPDPWYWTCQETGLRAPMPFDAVVEDIDRHAAFCGRGVNPSCCVGPSKCPTCALPPEDHPHA